MMPNTFLKVVDISGEIFSDIQSIDLRIMKIMAALIRIPKTMLTLSNSAFNEIIVVKVPAPARSGNAIGTILPDWLSPGSDLKNRIPRIISRPMKNITKDPAKANEDISTPNRPSIEAPANRKANMIPVAKLVTTEGLNDKPSFLIDMSTGIFPSISMTENKIKVTDNTAVKFISLRFLLSLKISAPSRLSRSRNAVFGNR